MNTTADGLEEESDPEEEMSVEIVEAALFSAGRPLSVPEIEESTGMDRREVRKGLKKLVSMYRNRRTAVEIIKVGPSYSMQLKAEFKQYALPVMEEDMEEDLLKTAAMIAYYQPVKQSELRKKLGEKVYQHVNELKEKGLILVEKTGRTYSVRTSPKFQEYFGLEAGDRDELKRLLREKERE